MARDQHQEWLAEFAADDARRRRQADSELARREAALKAARANLATSEAAVQELQAELDAEREQADNSNAS